MLHGMLDKVEKPERGGRSTGWKSAFGVKPASWHFSSQYCVRTEA